MEATVQTGNPAPSPLDYGRPPESNFRPADVLRPLVAWAAFAGVVMVSMSIVLKARQIFADFNVRLPGVTLILFSLQRWLTTWFGLIMLWLIPIGMMALAWPANRPVKRLIARAGVVMTLLFIVYVVLALGIPMMTIADGVSAQPGAK